MPDQLTNVYSDAQRRAMLEVARSSIRHGAEHRRALGVDPMRYETPLRDKRATFVTLHRHGDLRGCIGVLEPLRALIHDVAENAFAAGFRDPRFNPITPLEVDDLAIHISVLNPPEPMDFVDEADLIDQLRPGMDGLILEEGRHRGTFLPAVWDTIPDARQFLLQLKLKAGLPVDYWSDTVSVQRYRCESIHFDRDQHNHDD